MKKIVIRLSPLIIMLLAFSACDITESLADLGTLEPAIFKSKQPYCRYKLTKVNCDKPTQFKVGDIICIECCVERKPPWPKEVSVNNNCPKKITFKVADGNGCTIKAERLDQACTNCDPRETKAVFKCPIQKN